MLMLSVLLCGLTAADAQVSQGNQQSTNANKAVASTTTSKATAAKKTPKKKADNDSKPKPKAKPKANVAIINLSTGRTSLNVRQWPSIGDPNAKYVFVEMFDYTCPHCRNTHKAIHGAMEKYGKDLAIICLPVPLDGKCNQMVRVTNAKHAEACEVARIAIAVWRCKPSSFQKFHEWLFASPNARTAAAARAEGEKLVGKEKLTAELGKPYAKQYIASHVNIYRRAGAGQVPKLMFPRSNIKGEISSPTTLINLIQTQFAKR